MEVSVNELKFERRTVSVVLNWMARYYGTQRIVRLGSQSLEILWCSIYLLFIRVFYRV
jgi:hypothetical protein